MSNARYNLFPSKPAFFVKGGGNAAASSGTHVVILDTAVPNVDGLYSTSTGRFTAPFAGNYFFCGNLRIDSADVDYFRLRIRKNGTSSYSQPHSIYDLGTNWDPRYFSLTTSGVISLSENDYVELVAEINNDTITLYRSESSFSGFLVS